MRRLALLAPAALLLLSACATGTSGGNSYTDDNLPDGTYIYYLKAKSKEGTGRSTMTHHSETTEGYSVTVTSCYDIQDADTYTIIGATGGPGTWNGTTYRMNNKNSNINMFWNVQRYTNYHSSCTPNTIVTTYADDYHGNLYVSINGTTWTTVQTWDALASAFHVNGVPSAGLGKPGTGTYTVRFSTTSNGSNIIATATLVVPS